MYDVLLSSNALYVTLDENNVYNVFEWLDKIENHLATADYLAGNTFTEADIRLWTTVIR